MRFVPYHELKDSTPNIIVDGAAGPGTVLTLSHWPKSGTPAALKRDTSGEIVFAYLDSPASHVGAEIASNNHFDEDGLIGIFELLQPAMAEKHRALLIDAAQAGDFGVYRRREAARIAFAISAFADSDTSPLPAEVFSMPYLPMCGELYRRILEVVPAMLTNLEDFRRLWEGEDEKLSASEELIEKGTVTIEEQPELDLAIVRLPVDLAAQGAHRFAQRRLEGCHPFAANSHTNCARLLTIQGNRVEFQYRYESWVQVVSRRVLPRVDLKPFAEELNREERSGGKWVFDSVERITPRLHMTGSSASSIPAESIRKQLERFLTTAPSAWNPFD